MRQSKSPQQKKADSLKKDCRNDYGEHDKSSRKNIARGKARNRRAARRAARLAVAVSGPVSQDEADRIQTGATTRWVPRFRKLPDRPLGEYLARRREFQ